MSRSVLYVGSSYYNAWYLSRALRTRGWRATVLTYPGDMSDQFGHGWDISLDFGRSRRTRLQRARTVLNAFLGHQVIHFSGVHNLRFLYFVNPWRWPNSNGSDLRWLRRLGKKIVYSQSGCLDGVSQTTFSRWGPHMVCSDCIWRDRPDVCSDEKNLAWGRFRNAHCDFQVSAGGNRVDCNDDPRIHEVPEFYCLDPDVWRPDLDIPEEHRLEIPKETVKLYHAVGNFDLRTEAASNRNIKSTHIYRDVLGRLQRDGFPVDMVFVKDKPNTVVRYYQAQSDIVVDMLTYGFYGANVREAMMLGKPVVCYIRPEWLEQIGRELPEFVRDLPIVSATPETVYDVLADLIRNPAKRAAIGKKSREFALRWHSAERAADRFDRIYSDLIGGRAG